MEHITLAVTTGVIQQARSAGARQRQIAIQDASPELLASIRTARADKGIPIAVNGIFELSVGDTGAIWYTHQAPGIQSDDFISIYELLSRRPDRSVTFSWTV